MSLRVVAIPLVAAIFLGSPAVATTTTDDEQMVRGRGARDRSGSTGGGTASGGGDRPAGTAARRDGGDQPRAGVARRDDGDRRATGGDTTRNGDRRDRPDDQRVAVPRDPGRDAGGFRNNGPRTVSNRRPDRDINIINIGSFRGNRYYPPAYYDRWARSYYRWSPVRYAPWSLIYGSIGLSNLGFYGSFGPSYSHYGYPVYGNYGYGSYPPWQASGYDIGGVRLKIRPRDAQVFVDGYYAGLVDDFDGTFQSLRLEAGGHKIEIHMPGFEDLELDVHVQPGRTITLTEVLRPRP